MPLYKTQAIVIRSIPYGEVDKIVTLYTLDFGKVKGIAKGAKRSRKRFGNTLEIGSHIDLSFFEKETLDLVRLTQCDLIRSFSGLREDIRKLASASYFIELVNELTADKMRSRRLFELLVVFLETIDRGILKEEIERVFEVRLLALLGYQPLLDHCLRCKKGLAGEKIFFSVREGGILCPSCAVHLPGLTPVSLGTIKTLLLAQRISLEKVGRVSFSAQSLKESKTILSLFLEQYLRKDLKSKKFLEQFAPYG